jgi:hypothetical protein
MRVRQLRTAGVSVAIAFTVVFGYLSAGTVFAGTKVDVCHRPPGNPENFHTITINENALDAHLAHSDLVGPCSEHLEELCADENPCTQDYDVSTEQCLPTPRPAVDCNDSNPCTNDYCDPAGGCVNWMAWWEGDSCNTDLDYCESNPCLNGQCSDNQALGDVAPSYVCLCDPGWTGTNCDVQLP